MSIKLEFILKRNKSNLSTFIQKNKLTTFQNLLEYCESRRFIPCTEEEYKAAASREIVQDEQKKVKASGKTSKTQKPKKRRYSRKKQQSTPELPDSAN